jgi:transposase
VARPRDKAKVEAGVQIAERWILALLRHWNFFNLTEVNSAITHLLKKLNDRPFKKIPGTRTELFETIEKPALRPLPLKRYELAHWQKAKANIDYHVQADKHFYSVPHQLVSQEVEVRLSDQTVEIFYKGKRVASHKRSYRSGCYTTDPAHRPRSHQKYLQWTPSRLIQWAGSIGHECAQVVEKIIANRPHPEQGYRACLGIIRLGKHYGKEPLKAACERAIALDTCNYRSIESILKTKLYEQPFIESPPSSPIALFEHENVRGKYYYT